MTNPVQYNPNSPENFSDSLAVTQPDFLNNFATLYTIFNENHVALDAGATAGNHTFIDLITQQKEPQTNIGKFALYSKIVESTTNQVYMRQEGNQAEFQYTCYQIYPVQTTSDRTAYFTFLPGNLIVYFGTVTNAANQTVIDLIPAISKNIIFLFGCPVGATPFDLPGLNPVAYSATPPHDPLKIIEKVNVNLQPQKSYSYSYVIVGNI